MESKILLNPFLIIFICFGLFAFSTAFLVEIDKKYFYILGCALIIAAFFSSFLYYYIKRYKINLLIKNQEIDNLLKYSPFVIYISDENGYTELSSDRLFEWMDIDRNRLKKEYGYWYSFVHPDDVERVKQIYGQKEIGKNYVIEYRVRFKDGNYYWVSDEYQYLRHTDGSTRIFGFIKNIHQERVLQIEQERIEREAKEKEVMFQVLAGKLPMGMLMSRKNVGLIYANQQAKINRGISFDTTPQQIQEYFVKGTQQFVHPEDVQYVAQHREEIQKLLDKGETFISLKRMRKINSEEYRWYRSYIISAEDSLGKYVFEIEQDIHDEYVMQDKLKASEQNYRLLFDQSPIAKIIFDKESYKILAVNQRTCELLGYTEAELLTMNVLQIRDDKAKEVFKEDFSSSEKYSQKRTRHIRNKMGQEIIVETFAHPINFENKPAIMSVVIDITEQVKAKQAYIEAEKRYRNLFQHNLIGVFRSKLDGTILDANITFANLLGYTVEELLKINAKDLYYYQGDRNTYIENLKKYGKIENYEVILKHKAGHILYIVENVILSCEGEECVLEGTVMDVTERKLNEQKIQQLLQESLKTQQRLNYIVEYSPLPIIEWDENRKITLWNPAAERLFGYSKEEVLGKTTKIIIAPKDLEKAKENTNTLYKRRQSHTTLLLNNITKQGQEIICLWSNALIKDEQDKIKGVVSIAQDITQQVKAERTLQQREHLLSLVYDTATSAICVLNEEGMFQKVNKSFTEITGYEEQEVLNKPFISILKEKDQILAQAYQLKIIYGLVHKLRNWQICRKDGEFRDVYIVSKDIKLEDGSILVVTTFTDITAIKKSEFLLKQSEIKYKNLFENSIVGIFRTTLDGKVLEANQKAKEIFGWDNTNDINMLTDIYVHPEDKQNLFSELTSKGIVENFEFLSKKRSGEQIWISISARFYPEYNWIEGVCMDITEAKNNIIALQKANFELDSFTYRASHDLKAPLRSILGIVNLAKEENLSPEIAHYFDLIEKSVTRLDSFVVDLLALSRNNRTEVEIRPIDWEHRVKSCLEGLAYMDNFQKTDIQVQVNQKEEFYSDSTRIDLILNNLIANAIKYQPNKAGHQPKVYIQVNVFKHHAIFVVEDNGEGIPYEYQNKVFDMFFRASTTSDGSGLGLYIVKSAVEKLGGSIKMHSEPSIGTKFTVMLPNLNSLL
ncbi:MAG: PAS domain S-box protein [Bacteroidia bacterium]|nr:PAS domain S-box protein [Bacteroidia bacterium]MDW8346377.1 PAS domain S-box protein [Bacteroidia bacterium]